MIGIEMYLPERPDRLAVLAVATVSIIAVAGINFMPRPAANVAVVFPPWTVGHEAIRRATAAGGSIVRSGRFPFILIVHPDEASFSDKVLKRGALVVLDAEAIAGCVGSPL